MSFIQVLRELSPVVVNGVCHCSVPSGCSKYCTKFVSDYVLVIPSELDIRHTSTDTVFLHCKGVCHDICADAMPLQSGTR